MCFWVFLPILANKGIQLYSLQPRNRQESKAVKIVRVLINILICKSIFLYLFQGMSNGETGNFQMLVPFTPSEFVQPVGQKKKMPVHLQCQPLHPSQEEELQRDLIFFSFSPHPSGPLPLILTSVWVSVFFQIFFFSGNFQMLSKMLVKINQVNQNAQYL